MKVLLINPAVRPTSPQLMFNVGLVYIATALERMGAELAVLDVDVHRYSEEETIARAAEIPCDVIALGTLVSRYAWLKRVAAGLRKAHPKTHIIVGNTLGTSVPRIVCAKTAADICVEGEGDLTILELLEAIASGRDLGSVAGITYRDSSGQVLKTPERPVIDDIDTIPFPNYELFDIGAYLAKSYHNVSGWEFLNIPREQIIAMPLNTARGCPFHCSFCYHAFQDKRYRHRSPKNVYEEIVLLKKKYQTVHVDFWDELTFYSSATTEKFLDIMIEGDMKVSWLASMRSDLLTRAPLEQARAIAHKFPRAGAIGVSFALESGNPEILAAMNKLNTIDDFIKQTRLFREVGLPIYASIVLGYPQESSASIADTFDVLRQARIYPSVGYLQPMPGTPMYAEAIKMGRIADEEEYLMRMGDRQDLRVNLTSMDQDHMQELVKGHLIALNKELGTGLDEDHLIKTNYGYKADRKTVDTFLNSFGVAADVLRGTEQGGSC